ncbi:ATP-binding cassette sub-family C member 4-like isoform X1 [Athalia rosae]|uniref:ATP-binding cassette sub-family C member 4-like isoform X1 n=2 Tax=Athalia rosae TaxID=37344 RepID=UPI00203350CE|nr:ATP-binding cassette sub-family C member 4-like isoform X1 [Athalia rosae]
METKKTLTQRNPEEKANFLSKLVFGWTVPIFLTGAKKELDVTDLYDPLKSDESERLGDRLELEWKKELAKAEQELTLGADGKKGKSSKPSLTRALARMFWAQFMLQGLLLLCQCCIVYIIQVIVQGWIITYFSPGQRHSISYNDVLLYGGYLVFFTFLVVLLGHHTSLRNQQIGMKTRIACCSMIYRKVLRLNQAAASGTAAGQVANLMSNDVGRFDLVFMYLHHVWIMPIQILVMSFVMWQSVGVATIVGLGAMVLQTIPIQGYLSRISGRLRSKIAVKTDERVQLMSELIFGIQVVKMYAWEKPFESIVAKVRAFEIKLISYTSYLRGIYLSIIVFSERVTLYLTLITFVLMGNSLTAQITFVLANLFNILQHTCATCFPHAVIMAGEAAVSLERLSEFLLLEEVKKSDSTKPDHRDGTEKSSVAIVSSSQKKEEGIGIDMIKISANWVYGQLPPTLCQVSMTLEGKSLCAVVGSVGSGKSSLLHLLMGELPIGAGRLKFFSGKDPNSRINSADIKISYACQDPWLFSASIRDNILFGETYDEDRYKEVTRVCALHRDFQQLPDGDMSFVGERGAVLSGGQKARVNLARAVYRDADLYLLDDPLSAVDPCVGRILFDQCINGYLKGKTRILATHQIQYVSQADHIVVLNRGNVEHQGPPKGLESDFKMLETEASLEQGDAVYIEESSALEARTQSAKENIDNQDAVVLAQVENTTGLREVEAEEVEKGKMSSKVWTGYFGAGGNICSLGFLILIFIGAQALTSGCDYWVSVWTNLETLRRAFQYNKTLATTVADNDSKIIHHRKNETSDWYSEATYNPESLLYDEFGVLHSHVAIYVYTLCVVGCILLTLLRGILFFAICMKASRHIHDKIFLNLSQATMRFFNTHPSGRILNRFSKDVGAMDELLPRALLEALRAFSVMIGNLTVVAIVNNWMILVLTVMASIFWFIRVYYLKTAQEIKRLEGITKSPMFSHVTSTLNGLTTIRSRGGPVEAIMRKEFDQYQDIHTGAAYLTIATATMFGFILDLLTCGLIGCVCFSFILMDDGTTLGGYVGLALSQSLILTGMVQHGMRQSAEVVSQMTSVERVLQYSSLPKEGPFTTKDPPPGSWPSKGGIVFKNVSMRYAENKPPVLKNMNVTIEPGWKVGIVGRTGAGKSSLISALFCLAGDGLEGEISVDRIDTKSIGLHELRPKISIIPQEPILFSASLRFNLDPFEQYTDAELWDSLREVELGDCVPSLEFKVAGGGANFSVGQRQLICLARAILRNNRVLVLDEATANVDRNTDALIQNTIRRKFADCTVLTIAHRLNTIMDSDRVLVMSGGKIMEFGHPYLLLKNHGSYFHEMVQQTGKGMSEKLTDIAEVAYSQKYEIITDTTYL